MIHKKGIIFCMALLFLLGCQNINIDEPAQNQQSNMEETDNQNNNTLEENQEKEEKDAPPVQGQLTLHYIDVAQGDATLLQYEDNESQYNILYDAGDWLGSEVVPYLQQEDITEIDIVIISHPHADHIGQLTPVMEHFDIGEVWMSGNAAGSEVFTKAMTAVENSDAAYEEPRAGDQYDIGPLHATILHPDQLTDQLNEDSLSIHFEYGDTAFVFTGDAYQEQEKDMIQRELPLHANILQLGHHGSDTSSSPSFLDAVQPEIGIYSAGEGNSYGHPHQEVVSLFEEKGIDLYGTDQFGTIIATSDGHDVHIETAKEPANGKTTAPPTEDHTDNDDTSTQEQEETASSSSDCIDINHASVTELTGIKHIGEARAKDVMDGRPYDSVDDLSRVNGIGAKRLDDIKAENKACIGGDNS